MVSIPFTSSHALPRLEHVPSPSEDGEGKITRPPWVWYPPLALRWLVAVRATCPWPGPSVIAPAPPSSLRSHTARVGSAGIIRESEPNLSLYLRWSTDQRSLASAVGVGRASALVLNRELYFWDYGVTSEVQSDMLTFGSWYL